MMQKQQIENHRGLSGKRIVVLGGSSGIGFAVAQQAVAGQRPSLPLATRIALNKRSQRSTEKRKGTRWISQRSETFKISLRRSVISITWCSLPATRCN